MRHLSVLFMAVAVAVSACGGSPTDPVSTPSPAPAPSLPPALGAGPVLGTDRLVFDSTRHGTAVNTNHEIYVMRTDGSGAARLTNDGAYENWWPRVSPDRRKVLFYRSPAGSPENYDLASLWVMNTDGSAVTRLRAQGADGWQLQGHGEWSPDGNSIAMFGGTANSPQVYVTNASGQSPVQRTNRVGVNTDVAWSPNGQWLLFNGCPGTPCAPADYELYIVAAGGGTPTRLTFDSEAQYDPYFSPDGNTIAWLVNVNPAAWGGLGAWSIGRASISQTTGTWALSNPAWVVNDGQINSKPAWSLDGQTIYFHRMEPLASTPPTWGVFHIAPTGGSPVRLTPLGNGHSEHPSN